MAVSDLSHRFEGESVGRALELVGERWTLLILREAFFGGAAVRSARAEPWHSAAHAVLAAADARRGGSFDRVPYSSDPERHEYRLTEAGRDLFAAIVVLMQWGMSTCHAQKDHRSSCATTPAASTPTHA